MDQSYNISSPPEMFSPKGILKICDKFTGEHPCRSAISIKLLCNFIEIALRHGCSTVNLLHIFRIPFPKNTSGGLLLPREKNMSWAGASPSADNKTTKNKQRTHTLAGSSLTKTSDIKRSRQWDFYIAEVIAFMKHVTLWIVRLICVKEINFQRRIWNPVENL